MNNFQFYNPTRVIFGRGAMTDLGTLLPPAGRIMLTYGMGSIKRNGVYDQVMAGLAGRQVVEFGGIEPNPVYETLMRGAQVMQDERIEFLLAVGGGSVIDGTKFMAVAVLFDGGDPWRFCTERATLKPTAAVPIGCVLTLPATGSENNPFAVISRRSTQEKRAFDSDHVIPTFSVLDPETTFSLPRKQVRNGIVDSYVHTTEQYLTYPVNSPLQDRQAEGLMLTLTEEGPKALADLTDYDARANCMWCATQALNGLIGCGVPRDFATHLIGHEITAFYGLAHAETLAAILPGLLRHQKRHKRTKLLQYDRRVWGVTAADDDAAIEEGIRATERFFESLGMPTSLSAHGVDVGEAATRLQERLTSRNARLGERQAIGPEDVARIVMGST